MIIRKKLTPDEITPPNIRVNPDTGEVEQTFDGGATWTPAPDLDPRHAAGGRAPALTGGGAACDAAAGMLQATHDAIDATIDGLNAGMIATRILTIVALFLPGVGIIADIILGIAAAAYTIGTIAISSAMTPEVYDQLLCLLLTHVDASGQLDATAYAALRDDVDSTIGGVAAEVIKLMWDGTAEVGLSNAGALLGVTGDCAACATCVYFLGGDGLGDLEPVFDTTYDSGGDQLLGANFGSTQYCSFVYTGTEAMVSLDVQIDREGQTGALGTLDLFAMAGDNFGDLQPLYNVGGLGNGDGNTHIDFVMPSGYDQLYCSPGATGSGSQTCVIKKVTICSSS
jgi:hypothetical protein